MSCGWGSVDELASIVIGLWVPKSGSWPQALELLSDGAAARWKGDVSRVKKLNNLISETDQFQPLPGSVLSRDDEKVRPYGVSYAALHNLNTGVTQLQGAQELMEEGTTSVGSCGHLVAVVARSPRDRPMDPRLGRTI